MDALTRSLMMVANGAPVVLRTATANGSNYTAEFQISPNGIAGLTGGALYTWLLSGSAADYEISYTRISGNPLEFPAANAWYNLGSTRTFRRTDYNAGSTVTEFTIRRVSDSAIMARATITFTTVKTAPSIAVDISPSSITHEFDSASVNSPTATATASGGLGGTYDMVWSKTSGGNIVFRLDPDAEAATSLGMVFGADGMSPGEQRTANFRCYATDASGTGSRSITVTLKRPA